MSWVVVEKRVTPSGVNVFEHEVLGTRDEAESLMGVLSDKAFFGLGYASEFWVEEM